MPKLKKIKCDILVDFQTLCRVIINWSSESIVSKMKNLKKKATRKDPSRMKKITFIFKLNTYNKVTVYHILAQRFKGNIFQ